MLCYNHFEWSLVLSSTIYLHPVKLHRLLSEAIEQIVGVLGHSEVVQPLLRRQEESLVAILAITDDCRGFTYDVYSKKFFLQS